MLKTGLLFGLAAGIMGGVNAVISATLVGKIGEEIISYVGLLGITVLALVAGAIAAHITKRPIAETYGRTSIRAKMQAIFFKARSNRRI